MPMCVQELLVFGRDDLNNIDDNDHEWISSDEVTGYALDAKLVQAARREDIQPFKDTEVYELGPLTA